MNFDDHKVEEIAMDSGGDCPTTTSSDEALAESDPVQVHSPQSLKYLQKRTLLMNKYNYVRLSNDKLKNRLYHVKKEIKHLKRLKRVLCQRLLMCGDRFMDSFLEIPDNEPGSNVADKIIADVAAIASSSTSTVGAPRRRSRNDQLRRNRELHQSSIEIRSIVDAAKLSISSIIDSVITESHEERAAARAEAMTTANVTVIDQQSTSVDQTVEDTDDICQSSLETG